MSSIAFHERGWTVRVSGRERAAMGLICSDMLAAQIGKLAYQDLGWVEVVAKSGHYLHSEAVALRKSANESEKADRQHRLAQSLETWFSVGGITSQDALVLNGKPVDPFTIGLNSAVAWGNECIQLAAKLHAQCEIHAYCEGPDRAWLADLIGRCVKLGVFQAEPWGYDGWAAVMARLVSSSEAPVVTSYSVTDTFPNPSFAPEGMEMDEDDPWDTWSKFSEDDQWRWSMEALRRETSLRIAPETIGKRYGDRMTGAEFMERVPKLAPATVQ